jgi:hypothetical protein
VDVETSAANDEVVREMMARGMCALTGKKTPLEAWRQFVVPADVVGIKVNCGGYPHCISAYEIVAETIAPTPPSANRAGSSTGARRRRPASTCEVIAERAQPDRDQPFMLARGEVDDPVQGTLNAFDAPARDILREQLLRTADALRLARTEQTLLPRCELEESPPGRIPDRSWHQIKRNQLGGGAKVFGMEGQPAAVLSPEISR